MPVSVSGYCAVLGAFGAPVSGPKNFVPGGRSNEVQNSESGAHGQVWFCANAFAPIIRFDMRAARAPFESTRAIKRRRQCIENILSSTATNMKMPAILRSRSWSA